MPLMDYLLELGTEELPHGEIVSLLAQFQAFMAPFLAERGLAVGGDDLRFFSTPRRLAVCLSTDLEFSAERLILHKGPPLKVGEAAKLAFARKFSVEPTALLERDGVYFYEQSVSPVAVQDIFREACVALLASLRGDRWATWGEGEFRFARPVRWLVCMAGSEILELSAFGLASGRLTRPNRLKETTGAMWVEIPAATDYESLLEKNLVIACPDKRRKKIMDALNRAGEDSNGTTHFVWIKSAYLLDEVVNLVEDPCVLKGNFEEKFLNLPEALICKVLEQHQRYFPLFHYRDPERISGFFASVVNALPDGEANAISGNQRVVNARLSDALFTLSEDEKKGLEAYRLDLKNLTHFKELGSYERKAERLVWMAEKFAKDLNLSEIESIDLITAAKFSKADLLSKTVGEFPELQGFIGAHLAAKLGLKSEVCDAIKYQYIKEFYPPSSKLLSPSWDKPSIVWQLAIFDRIDQIFCCFAIGKLPTGSSDPYALRQQMQTVADFLLLLKSYDHKLPNKYFSLCLQYFFNLASEALRSQLNSSQNEILLDAEGWEKLNYFCEERIKYVAELALGHSDKLGGLQIKPGKWFTKNGFTEAFFSLDLSKNPQLTSRIGFPLLSFSDSVSNFSTNQSFDLSPLFALLKRSYKILGKDLDLSTLAENPESANPDQMELLARIRDLEAKTGNFSEKLQSDEYKVLCSTWENFFEKVLVSDPNLAIANANKATLVKALRLFSALFLKKHPQENKIILNWDALASWYEGLKK